jgi:hypothetical protein
MALTNPTLAKRVWESMANPSTRRVATKLRQAGSTISHQTINRWRRDGWRPLEHERRHPLEAAREQLDDAAPLLTGNPLTTAQVLVEQSTEREKLERLSDDELLRRAAREVTIAVYILAKAMVAKAAVVVAKPAEVGVLMRAKPAEVGVLMRALAECVQAATAALAKRGPPRLHS